MQTTKKTVSLPRNNLQWLPPGGMQGEHGAGEGKEINR